MEPWKPKFSLASVFICTKCGKDFGRPENADELKSELRAELRALDDAHLKIRVMTSGCLGVCESKTQAFAYYPNEGRMQMMIVPSDQKTARKEILEFLKTKI